MKTAFRVCGLLAVVVPLVATACGGRQPRAGPPSAPRGDPGRSVASPRLLRIRTIVEGRARTLAVPLEEYVLASALTEIAPPGTDVAAAGRAFELQAIVVRTYAVANLGRHGAEGVDLCDTTHCQLLDLDRPNRSRWATVARGAVDRTRGKALYYGNVPVMALYHADCGGHLAAASEVWGGAPVPYYTAGPDPLPAGRRHLEWTYAIDREQLRRALNTGTRTAVGDRLDTIDVQSRDASGRARLVLLNGSRAPLVRGEELRAVMAAALGPRTIRSARFEVRRSGQQFIFTGQGFGHGVGLCQAGALARTAAGEPVEKILAFYYPRTRLR